MENQNKEQKQNNENIPQNVEEIESLNDSDELDLETLEEIDGAGCCNVKCDMKASAMFTAT